MHPGRTSQPIISPYFFVAHFRRNKQTHEITGLFAFVSRCAIFSGYCARVSPLENHLYLILLTLCCFYCTYLRRVLMGVMACLQGYLLRYLLYEQPTLDHVKRYAHSLRAALHFWRARRAARGRASERQCRLSLSRLLARATHAWLLATPPKWRACS